jgi:hypothetical protein
MLVANPLAKFWIAGTNPEMPVELAADGTGASLAGAAATVVVVAFAAISKSSFTDMPCNRERQ